MGRHSLGAARYQYSILTVSHFLAPAVCCPHIHTHHRLPYTQAFCAALDRHVRNTTWTVGEVLLVDPFTESTAVHADFLAQGGSASVFGFPMSGVLHKVLRVSCQRGGCCWCGV